MLICKALLKYGYSGFKLEILEYCDKKDTLVRENYYLTLLKPEYNVLQEGFSRLGTKHSLETRKKMSEAQKGEKSHMKGKTRNVETRAKISSTLLMRGGSPTEVLNIKTNEKNTYVSSIQAAAAVGCSAWTIRSYKKSGKLFKDIYKIT